MQTFIVKVRGNKQHGDAAVSMGFPPIVGCEAEFIAFADDEESAIKQIEDTFDLSGVIDCQLSVNGCGMGPYQISGTHWAFHKK